MAALRYPTLAIVTLLVAFAATAGLNRTDDAAQPGEPSTDRSARPLPTGEVRAARAAAKDARPVLAAFRRKRTKRDRVPEALVASGLLSNVPGDPDHARRLAGSDAWMLPSTDGRSICQLDARNASCVPISVLVRKGVSLGVSYRYGEPIAISGVARDGVRSVALVYRHGGERIIRVRGNAFAFASPSMPRFMRWKTPDGVVHVDRASFPNVHLVAPPD